MNCYPTGSQRRQEHQIKTHLYLRRRTAQAQDQTSNIPDQLLPMEAACNLHSMEMGSMSKADRMVFPASGMFQARLPTHPKFFLEDLAILRNQHRQVRWLE